MSTWMGFGIFDVSVMPKDASIFCTLGSSGSSVPSWKESGFLSDCKCLMPRAASPASYSPADRLKRGSVVLEPTIPGGNVGAGLGVACCPTVTITEPENNNKKDVSKPKAILRI